MRTIVALMALILTLWASHGVAQDAAAVTPPLPRVARAPASEFPTGLQWLNTDQPLHLRALRGKVVLLDFWTYGCINCLHVLPDLQRLEAAYARELMVIGVHSAKYDNEAALANIRQAVQRYGITHPVVNDRDLRIWKAYRVSAWPTQIVIDPEGGILQGFVGENHYARLDHLIKTTVALHRQKGTLRAGPLVSRATLQNGQPSPLLYPGKVVADAASSRLCIADSNHHRLVLTDLGGKVLTVIGSGTAGASDGSFATATFRQPQGMAVQGDMLYVADTGNHLLRRVDMRQRRVETVAGTGAKAREFNVPGSGRRVALNSPWDLSVHGQHLYIAMAGMHQLWRFDLTTSYVEPFSGSGREDLVDDIHVEAALGQPSGLSGDGRQLYVADSEVNAIRAASLDPDGALRTLAGGGLFTFGDQDGAGPAIRLQHPLGIAYAKGMVYVADTYNHKIKVLHLSSDQMRTLAGTGVAGYHDGPAAQAQFYEPGGLSIASGKLYVADTNNHRVRVIDMATRTVSTLPLPGLTPPVAAVSTFIGADDAAVVRLTEQSLTAATRAALRLVLELPSGWKVNDRAPATLTVTVAGKGVQVPEAYARQTLLLRAPHLTIPMDVAQHGTQALLQVDLTFVICQAAQQGICAFRRAVWEVPVRSRAQAGQSVLTLQYPVAPF